jgi:catechol 2,3-dioxygenase-like lactoylglutathione lyase family enzyme
MKSKIDHIAILVDDLDVAERWYTDNLDGFVAFRDQKYTRIQLENINIALIDKNHYSHNHFAVLVENKEDLPAESGMVVHHRDGTIGVYVEDPFGNYLEYIWYSPEQKEVFLDD